MKSKTKAHGKRKAAEGDESSEDGATMELDVEMDGVDVDEDDVGDGSGGEGGDEEETTAMPESGGIEELRKKLHARMAELRRGGKTEAGGRDELLEERRRQRAVMRERRRKETKEKIRREAELKDGKKRNERQQDIARSKAKVGVFS